MKLSEWLKAPGTNRTQDALGRKVGLSQGRISQIAAAGTDSLATALAIEAATENAVTVTDLLMPTKKPSEQAEASAA